MSKTTTIKRALQSGEKLTHLKALAYGTHRLAAIIYNLRKQGYNIVTKIRHDSNGTEFAEYSLAQ